MQVKHLLLLVVLILMIPPGFYWLMSQQSAPPKPEDPFLYEIVKTDPEPINLKIHDREPVVESNFYDAFTNQLETVPTWLVQDANF